MTNYIPFTAFDNRLYVKPEYVVTYPQLRHIFAAMNRTIPGTFECDSHGRWFYYPPEHTTMAPLDNGATAAYGASELRYYRPGATTRTKPSLWRE
jgi:hypothetical protein